MGKIRSLQIALSGPQTVYYGGQQLAGNVLVDVKDEVKITEIRLQFLGYSNVHWSESHGSGNHRRTVHYRAREDYVNTIISVLAPPPGSKELIMQPGQYQYPFNFLIPQGVPGSFESSIGQVRYYLHACVDIPWAFDEEYKLMFTVLSHFDLNQVPTAATGVMAENSKTLCCWCCESGPINAKLSLDRIGYVPGEAITIKGEIQNGSNRRMSSSSARILMSVTYHARSKSRTVNTDVAEIKKGEIAKGDSEVWFGEKLVIPPVPPSDLPGCNIIQIKYFAVLTVDPAGPSFDLDAPAEIIIGTVPLRQVVQQYNLPPQPGGPAPLPQLDYGDTAYAPPPPTYAQSHFGAVNFNHQGAQGDDEDGYGEKVSANAVQPQSSDSQFTPMYTYYKWD